MAYLSGKGKGNRCFCRRELITIVTPLSRPGSAKTAASVGLYGVYRKQERSLFTAALEQTSNVPTAIIGLRPTAGLWSPKPSIRSAMASLRRAACLHFDRCATAPETRPLPAISCAHPSRDVYRLSSGVQREGVIPRPVVRGPMAVALPRSRSPRTLPTPTVLSAQLPAMLIVRRQDGVPSSAGNGGRTGR